MRICDLTPTVGVLVVNVEQVIFPLSFMMILSSFTKKLAWILRRKKIVVYQGKYCPLLVSLVATNTIEWEMKYGLSTEYQFFADYIDN